MYSKLICIIVIVLVKCLNAQTDQTTVEIFTTDENISTTNDVSFAATTDMSTIAEDLALGENTSIRTVSNASLECGKFNDFTRIINGEKVIKHSHPWLVRLEWKRDRSWSFSCGGTLITRRHVLTAAHCVSEKEILKKNFRFTFGVHNCEDLSHAVHRSAKRAFVHKQFSMSTMANDIAIIELNEPVEFNRFIKPMKIWAGTNQQMVFHRAGTVLGWGVYSQFNFETSCELLQASIPIISNTKCSQLYKRLKNLQIRNTNICALYDSDVPQDTCQGDSGGPILIKLEDHYELVGITSWGNGCAEKDYPGVYTFLPEYRDWIQKRVSAEKMC